MQHLRARQKDAEICQVFHLERETKLYFTNSPENVVVAKNVMQQFALHPTAIMSSYESEAVTNISGLSQERLTVFNKETK